MNLGSNVDIHTLSMVKVGIVQHDQIALAMEIIRITTPLVDMWVP